MRKDQITKPLAATLMLGALVAASAALSFTQPAAALAGQTAQKGRAKFRRVRVTPNDIARLPAGKNYVVYVGSTPVNGGVLNSRVGGSVVYEFRSDPRPIDYGRVVVQAGADAAPVPLEEWLRKHRPAAGMRGWPFKRLLIGPAEGIAEVEGWKTKDGTPGTEYKCELGGDDDDFCGCSGILDCTLLSFSGNCASDMSCDGSDCFCDYR